MLSPGASRCEVNEENGENHIHYYHSSSILNLLRDGGIFLSSIHVARHLKAKKKIVLGGYE